MKKIFKGIAYYFSIIGVLIGMLNASDRSSSIHIKLTPIAVNADKVLFATQKYENTVGAVRPCVETDFGWLVVSSAGVWDERNAYRYDCKKEEKKIYEQYLKGKFTVKKPDKALGELIKRYEFYTSSVLESEPYVYEIKSKQSCFKGKCLEQTTKQKTLGKIVSTKQHSSIQSSFYYKGVALFHNVMEDYTLSYPEPAIGKLRAKGASFDIKTNGHAYSTSYIDGLVFFDPYAFRQPSSKTKEEVEAVVKEMFSLFRKKDIDTLNKRFIHPKYGFYHMYRPGAMDVASHHMKLEKTPSKTWTKENTLFRASKIGKTLKWESVDTYCENQMWTKEGIFVHQVPYLSVLGIWKYWEGSNDMNPSKEEKQKAKFLMQDIFVIVDTKADLVFYIKKIDGKWYLTHIDRAALDCSV